MFDVAIRGVRKNIINYEPINYLDLLFNKLDYH